MALEFKKSVQCGCNNTATKSISKTASTIRITKFQRPTPSNVWSKISLIAIVLIMTQLILTTGQVDAMSIRRRLRKRHSNTNGLPDWENPCGGLFVGTHSAVGQVKRRVALKVVFATAEQIIAQHNTSKSHKIQTDDINNWSAHNKSYKFLPKILQNSSVALKRWHNSTQIYVASFSYLFKKSTKYDEIRHNTQLNSPSRELHDLLDEARLLLCEIESAINRTIKVTAGRKLTSRISPEEMDKHLKFHEKTLDTSHRSQVEMLDLKFAKFYFMEFVKTMKEILEVKLKHYSSRNSSASASASESSSLSGSSDMENSNEINASTSGRRHPHHHNKKNRKGKKQRNREKRLKNALQRRNSTPSIALA